MLFRERIEPRSLSCFRQIGCLLFGEFFGPRHRIRPHRFLVGFLEWKPRFDEEHNVLRHLIEVRMEWISGKRLDLLTDLGLGRSTRGPSQGRSRDRSVRR